MGNRTFFSFARPSAIEGAARLFDFAGSLDKYNTMRSGADADEQSLYADWAAVGDDLRLSISRTVPTDGRIAFYTSPLRGGSCSLANLDG